MANTLDEIREAYDRGDPEVEYGPDGCNPWGDEPDDVDDLDDDGEDLDD